MQIIQRTSRALYSPKHSLPSLPGPSTFPLPSQINPVHIFQSPFCKINFNFIFTLPFCLEDFDVDGRMIRTSLYSVRIVFFCCVSWNLTMKGYLCMKKEENFICFLIFISLTFVLFSLGTRNVSRDPVSHSPGVC
jgi:hypothetical protein